MDLMHEPIDVPRPKKRVTFGLIILAIFMPWLALYLDGASWQTIWINVATWFFLFPVGVVGSIIHAIVCVCRRDKHRVYSNPARRRLRYHNDYSAKPHTDDKTVKSSATSSSTSVSSSDVEKETAPPAAPAEAPPAAPPAEAPPAAPPAAPPVAPPAAPPPAKKEDSPCPDPSA